MRLTRLFKDERRRRSWENILYESALIIYSKMTDDAPPSECPVCSDWLSCTSLS